jgi:hypothetical protein
MTSNKTTREFWLDSAIGDGKNFTKGTVLGFEGKFPEHFINEKGKFIHAVEVSAIQEANAEIEILRSKQSQYESTLLATIVARDKYKQLAEMLADALVFYEKGNCIFIDGSIDIEPAREALAAYDAAMKENQ